MATRNEQVMEMVARELEENPGIDPGELFARAKELDPAIGDLTRRQFNARYPLQVKRSRAAERGDGAARPAGQKRGRRTRQPKETPAPRQRRRAPARAAAAADREAVRAVFLQFARDFATAESRSEIVSVLGNLDSYVDQVVGSEAGE